MRNEGKELQRGANAHLRTEKDAALCSSLPQHDVSDGRWVVDGGWRRGARVNSRLGRNRVSRWWKELGEKM